MWSNHLGTVLWALSGRIKLWWESGMICRSFRIFGRQKNAFQVLCVSYNSSATCKQQHESSRETCCNFSLEVYHRGLLSDAAPSVWCHLKKKKKNYETRHADLFWNPTIPWEELHVLKFTVADLKYTARASHRAVLQVAAVEAVDYLPTALENHRCLCLKQPQQH